MNEGLGELRCRRHFLVVDGDSCAERAGYRFIGQTSCKTEKTGRISGSYPVTHPVLILTCFALHLQDTYLLIQLLNGCYSAACVPPLS